MAKIVQLPDPNVAAVVRPARSYLPLVTYSPPAASDKVVTSFSLSNQPLIRTFNHLKLFASTTGILGPLIASTQNTVILETADQIIARKIRRALGENVDVRYVPNFDNDEELMSQEFRNSNANQSEPPNYKHNKNRAFRFNGSYLLADRDIFERLRGLSNQRISEWQNRVPGVKYSREILLDDQKYSLISFEGQLKSSYVMKIVRVEWTGSEDTGNLKIRVIVHYLKIRQKPNGEYFIVNESSENEREGRKITDLFGVVIFELDSKRIKIDSDFGTIAHVRLVTFKEGLSGKLFFAKLFATDKSISTAIGFTYGFFIRAYDSSLLK